MARATITDDDRAVFEHCGQRLACLLAARGWNGPELAAQLGVHRCTVHAYLTGRIGLTVPMLLRIAALLDVPPSLLLPGHPDNPITHLETLLLHTPPELYQDVMQQATILLRAALRNRSCSCQHTLSIGAENTGVSS